MYHYISNGRVKPYKELFLGILTQMQQKLRKEYLTTNI